MAKSRRVLRVMIGIVIAAIVVAWFAPRPSFLPLSSYVDGPPPSKAAGIVVFLHGRGGSIGRVAHIARELREDGLPNDYAIVFVEGPFKTPFGHSWGGTASEQATSRARIRSLLRDLGGPSPIVIGGFSQGAGVALDLAVEEPRVGAVASFSPCFSFLRGELPKREKLRVLLAHGTSDATCPIEESRSLARVLEAAKKPVKYIEFDGGHVVPPEAVRALAYLSRSSSEPM